MTIRGIVLVWFALSAIGTLITYVTHRDYNEKWLVMVQAIAISMLMFPVLVLMTVFYLRYLKVSVKWLREFFTAEDSSRSEGPQ